MQVNIEGEDAVLGVRGIGIGIGIGNGFGAELIVRLPLAKTKPVVRHTEPRAVVSDSQRRVLVIEDNIDAAESLKEALELDGHDVRVAYDGHDGVQQAIAFEPDVVFCDIGLPDMDGCEVAETLREHVACTGTELVALSGYAQPEDVERARAAGFHRHMSKPPSLDELERVIRQSGGRRAQRGTSAA